MNGNIMKWQELEANEIIFKNNKNRIFDSDKNDTINSSKTIMGYRHLMMNGCFYTIITNFI
jgi:hypothetical protein